jgi:hypothetical protein
MNGEVGAMFTGFWCRNLKERCQSEDSGVAKRIILKWVVKESEGLTIDLTEDRDRRRAVVNTVMNLRFL